MDINYAHFPENWIVKIAEFSRFLSTTSRAEEILIQSAHLSDVKVNPYSPTHCERVAYYSGLCGSALELPEKELKILYKGSLLHDVGKIAVPDFILLKDRALHQAEQEFIRAHPEIGTLFISRVESLQQVLPAIKYHHERFNGSGYPEGLEGKRIPLHARIIALVDCFDALTTHRSYRRALSVTEALQVMDEETKKGLWDPDLFRKFVDIIEMRFDIKSAVFGKFPGC